MATNGLSNVEPHEAALKIQAETPGTGIAREVTADSLAESLKAAIAPELAVEVH